MIDIEWKEFASRYPNESGVEAVRFDGTEEMANALKEILAPHYEFEIKVAKFKKFFGRAGLWQFVVLFPVSELLSGDYVVLKEGRYSFWMTQHFVENYKEVINEQ